MSDSLESFLGIGDLGSTGIGEDLVVKKEKMNEKAAVAEPLRRSGSGKGKGRERVTERDFGSSSSSGSEAEGPASSGSDGEGTETDGWIDPVTRAPDNLEDQLIGVNEFPPVRTKPVPDRQQPGEGFSFHLRSSSLHSTLNETPPGSTNASTSTIDLLPSSKDIARSVLAESPSTRPQTRSSSLNPSSISILSNSSPSSPTPANPFGTPPSGPPTPGKLLPNPLGAMLMTSSKSPTPTDTPPNSSGDYGFPSTSSSALTMTPANTNFTTHLRNLSIPRPLPGTSTPTFPFHKPKTLILDLDETLIHSTSRPLAFSQGSGGGGGLVGISLAGLFSSKGKRRGGVIGEGHTVEVVLGGRSTLYHVYKRPFVDHFLKKVSCVDGGSDSLDVLLITLPTDS